MRDDLRHAPMNRYDLCLDTNVGDATNRLHHCGSHRIDEDALAKPVGNHIQIPMIVNVDVRRVVPGLL